MHITETVILLIFVLLFVLIAAVVCFCLGLSKISRRRGKPTDENKGRILIGSAVILLMILGSFMLTVRLF